MAFLFLHVLDALAVVIEVANHANDTMKQGVSLEIKGWHTMEPRSRAISFLPCLSVGQLSEAYADSIQLKWTPRNCATRAGECFRIPSTVHCSVAGHCQQLFLF